VLDVGLPVMDGYELARRIRVRTSPNTPLLVAVAGYGEALSRTGENDESFDARLDRPVSLTALLERLDAHQGMPQA
jgi:CheY-like chemotaxis protein